MNKKNESVPVLMIVPSDGGLWQVRLQGSGLLLGLSSKEVARRFALNWALVHGPCEIHLYRKDGNIQQVIFPPAAG